MAALSGAIKKMVRKKGGVTGGDTFAGIPFIPPGVYSKDEMNVDNLDEALKSVDLRKELEGFSPRLNAARASGDIFAYSSILQDLRSTRAKRLNEDLPMELPDEEMLQKEARRRNQRRRSGRQSTILTGTLGPASAGL